MKRFIKCVCFFLAILTLVANPALAAENVEPRASSYFMASSVYLWKTTGTTFEVWFDVTAVGGMDELGAKTIKVQRSSDNETWTTMKTFSKDDYYSQMIDEDTCHHANCVTYTGTAGYYYRAYIVLYAKNSSGTGEVYRYTASIKL